MKRAIAGIVILGSIAFAQVDCAVQRELQAKQHECGWQHLTDDDIDALNLLVQHGVLDEAEVNAMFELDDRCGADPWCGQSDLPVSEWD